MAACKISVYDLAIKKENPKWDRMDFRIASYLGKSNFPMPNDMLLVLYSASCACQNYEARYLIGICDASRLNQPGKV
jgi:hypothetical protein